MGLYFLFILFIFLEMPLKFHLVRDAKQIIAYTKREMRLASSIICNIKYSFFTVNILSVRKHEE